MGGGQCSSSAASASSGRLCRDGKPFPVTQPQHNPCRTRITPQGFQLLQPWEKRLARRAGYAPENHAGSGHAEMGCSDSSCLSVNALHSSPSARLTSCCSTAKNNRSPDERKCTGRVRGRQWFWQGCLLGKAGRGGNGEMEREETAPRNPCVCRGFIACAPPSDLQIPCVSALKISFPAARSSSPAEAVS